jgi:hypothetical protein
MPVHDKHENYNLPCIELIEFLQNQRNNLIYFYILPCQVEKKVYEEYSKYLSKIVNSENIDLYELNALALAAYAKVTKLKLYPGVLHRETIEEEEEVKGQMELTHEEFEKTKEMLVHMSPSDKEEMLKIQQKRGLATLKYMAWETRVNEENLLDFWFQMTLDANAYQNMKGKMNKAKEKKRQYDIGPFPLDHFNYYDIRYWALETLGINEFTDDYTATTIKERFEILSSQYNPDKEENSGDPMCEDICERIDKAYQWLKNHLHSTPTKSVFSFSGLPSGFPLVFQKNKYFVDTSSCYD